MQSIYEKMIMNRLKIELRLEKILHLAQGAFQKHKSSIDEAAFICRRIFLLMSGINMQKIIVYMSPRYLLSSVLLGMMIVLRSDNFVSVQC